MFSLITHLLCTKLQFLLNNRHPFQLLQQLIKEQNKKKSSLIEDLGWQIRSMQYQCTISIMYQIRHCKVWQLYNQI
ncbi:unnamed protein product [Paramecium octaurelia]|uniref:Uncharacterized protein n=1 Tax=Paramecium octaurelia TaxID=43137 RepID=A0A8S1YEM9_PAROT|nr:unnamed protein product [Paramecium octaurelia]